MTNPLNRTAADSLSNAKLSFYIGGYRFTCLRWGADRHKTDVQPAHHHAFCEIVLLHEGKIISEANEQIIEATAPAVLLNMPGEVHEHRQEAAIALDWVGFSIAKDNRAINDGLDSLVSLWLKHYRTVSNNAHDVATMVARLEKELLEQELGWRQSCTWILQHLVLGIIRATLLDVPDELEQHLELEAALRAAIRQDPAHPWSVDDLAQLAGVSDRQLNRLLRKQADTSALELVSSERMNLAQSLLLTEDQTVEACALQLGYADKRYFSRLFKKFYGVSPQQWREQAEAYRVEVDES